MINPALDTAIQHLLEQQTHSEFELIKALQKPPFELLDGDALSDNLRLFQCHFVVYNSLYRLRQQGLDRQSFILDILPTAITMQPFNVGVEALVEADPLAEYYLDWRHFDKTSSEDVDALISDFWLKMAGVMVDEEAKQKALLCLGFEQLPNRKSLKQRYRQLLHKNHPDKGGIHEATVEIQQAYQLLLTVV